MPVTGTLADLICTVTVSLLEMFLLLPSSISSHSTALTLNVKDAVPADVGLPEIVQLNVHEVSVDDEMLIEADRPLDDDGLTE